MSDVFISYKAEDRKRIQPLVQALQADGYSVWWDEHIGTGDEWRQTIEKQLDSAKCVLVVWSKRSVGPDGNFVRDEAARAQKRHVYVPVLIDSVNPPLGFGESQAASLRGWKGDRSDERYRAVLSAVNRIAGPGTHTPEQDGRQLPVSRRGLIAGGAVAAIAIAGVGGWALLKPGSGGASDSIAVLPFANLSGDPRQAYFSDGIAEEIRNALARLAQLQVVARTSSELVQDMDVKAAARKLDVANILTGSVRRSPSTIRVSAQLIDGHSGIERWSATYDRPLGDTLKIQSGIAQNVAEALSIELGQSERHALAVGGTDNAQAQDLVLQSSVGQLDGTEPTLRRALARIDKALELDPDYAEAWARKGLFLSFQSASFARSSAEYRETQDRAVAAARHAIALAPDFGGGYTVLGEISRVQLDFAAALSNFERGLSLTGAESARPGYAHLLGQLGRPDDALRQIDIVKRQDPLNGSVFTLRGRILFNARRYHEAVGSTQRALELAPDNANALDVLADAFLALGQLDQASKQYGRLPADSPYRLTDEAIVAEKRSDRAESDRLLARLNELYENTVNYQLAQIYAQRGEADRAFAALDAAWTYRDPGLARLKVDPFIDPIRGDPRFATLMQKLNFL